MGTITKKISGIGSILAIVISIVTFVSVVCGWIGSKAIASDKINTLWTERTTMNENVNSIKIDIAVMKNDVSYIKDILQKKYGY